MDCFIFFILIEMITLMGFFVVDFNVFIVVICCCLVIVLFSATAR
jgi:hypothetical protein